MELPRNASPPLSQYSSPPTLRLTDNKFQLLFQQSADAILILTADGHIIDTNEAAGELLGYTNDEFFGMSSDQLIKDPSGEDPFLPHVNSDSITEVDVPLETKQGREIIASVSIAVCDQIATDEHLLICLLHDRTREYQLKRELIDLQEEERRRIGRDLHDSIGSELVGAAITLEQYADRLDRGDEVTPQQLRQLRHEIARSTEQLRNLSRGLDPVRLGPEHLTVALQQLAQQITEQIRNRCVYHDNISGDMPLSEPQATHLFRIAQEATANARKHGQPSHITIELKQTGTHVQLVIEDDGHGFEPSSTTTEGLGIVSMRYRAERIGADLAIDSTVGEGTTVNCTLPT
jgi:PAS domain S-box-containing protein